MKTTIAITLAFACLSAHAEDVSPAIRSCGSYATPGEFVSLTAAPKSKPHMTDGVAYFKPRPGVTFNSDPVVAVYAYGHDVPYPAGVKHPGSDTYGYGVVVEGTIDFGRMQVKGSRAHVVTSPVSVPGHEFVEIGCND
ncbi:hypothetical protein [Burkholderia sp. Ac-20344]|uniref:hypothetical protein n=1 Tax=Burkholderia sp. Ac-20344 TaxID=2703890 RepID=UPI00197C3844|nr:hypothetical protein [Burkholderia sp. Ac-20344]MBN3833169.1 hypothetical protein [Burkholderia sp. Ac-20344]